MHFYSDPYVPTVAVTIVDLLPKGFMGLDKLSMSQKLKPLGNGEFSRLTYYSNTSPHVWVHTPP